MISVVTPSFNMLPYLKRCHYSIRDQEGADVEHIVVDGKSNDGTVEWINKKNNIKSLIEKDDGMYDAVNKGLSRSRGDILCYLNCDEQYLPGTLSFVQKYFDQNSNVDILFGDHLLIKPDGSLISFRKGYTPRWYYILTSHLYVLSCTMFFRRNILEDGFLFDTYYKDIGDQDFVVRLLKAGYETRHVSRYQAAFTMTGENMSTGENAKQERREAFEESPTWLRVLKYPLNALRLGEKFLSGAYFHESPLTYRVYPSSEAEERKEFQYENASFIWREG